MSMESYWTSGTVLSSDSYRFVFTVHQALLSPKIKEKWIPHDLIPLIETKHADFLFSSGFLVLTIHAENFWTADGILLGDV